MKPKGSSRKAVLTELDRIQAINLRYDDGRILCSMCTKPHPIAQKAYRMFLESNLGDPGLFPGSVQLEKQVVSQLAQLLHSESTSGFVVSGGTEANFMALLAARERSAVDKPEVILPKSAHFSFEKICRILKIKPIYVDLNSSFEVETSLVEKQINRNTVAVVGTVGTAELGVVDSIDSLSQIAGKHNIWLHVDAAFGGLVLPFMEDHPRFDFELEAVQSVTVDPHKMGMAAIPAGSILFRENKLPDNIKTETPYLSEKVQYTFVGTRSGGAAASAWAVLNYLGIAGYKQVVTNCIRNTKHLTDELELSGFKLLVKPSLNIVAFRSGNTKRLAEQLWKRGWYVSYIPRYECIRIVLMPHTKRKHIDAFLRELHETERL